MSDEEGFWHTIRQGDSVASLAFENGLFWQTVWNHPSNANLRRMRKYQNVLYPGDEIFIPAKCLKYCTCNTEKRHQFVKKGVPEKLNLRFLDLEDKPIKNEPCQLNIDGRLSKATLDGDGWLHVSVPPNARTGEVSIGRQGEYGNFQLALGHLDPITEMSGIQARLKHLGYYDGPLDGESSEELDNAVLKFREKRGLEAGTVIDDAFRDKLGGRDLPCGRDNAGCDGGSNESNANGYSSDAGLSHNRNAALARHQPGAERTGSQAAF